MTENKYIMNWSVEKQLYQIQAIKDFAFVKNGDIGGYIEKSSNLSQSGDAWIFNDAQVFGVARVFDDARVYGNAPLRGDR